MSKTITVSAKQYEDFDDCLQAAADDYISEHPEAEGYDLSPRWVDDEREEIALDVPGDDSERPASYYTSDTAQNSGPWARRSRD